MLQLDEIGKRIDNIYENQKKLSRVSSSTFFTRDSRFSNENNQIPGLESSCMRSIRETCETISSHFGCEYNRNAGISGDEFSENDISKDSLWNKVENIIGNFSPQEIYEALLMNIKDSASNLKDICSKIDLKRDAENLKFMFETGKLKDVSSKPTLVKTVQQLIEEGEVTHFKKFVDCERSKNEAWKVEERLQQLNKSINETLKNNFPPEKANKIRNMFSLEQEHSSYITSKKFLQTELVKLKVEREEKEHSLSVLLKKYNQIQNFDKTCRSKQKVIHELIKTNGSAKARQRQQLEDIKTSTEQKIVKMHSELPHLCQRYHELIDNEVKHYLNIPVQNLETIRSVSEKRLLVADMSIHRTSCRYDQPGQEYLKKIAERINVPQYAPTESVIPAVMTTKNKMHTTEKKIGKHSNDVEELSETTREVTKIQQNLSRFHDEDIKLSVPSLKESEHKSADIMTECTKFRSAVQLWWDQPAQQTVPWVCEDGLNISQYLERFSIQASLLKKLQLNR